MVIAVCSVWLPKMFGNQNTCLQDLQSDRPCPQQRQGHVHRCLSGRLSRSMVWPGSQRPRSYDPPLDFWGCHLCALHVIHSWSICTECGWKVWQDEVLLWVRGLTFYNDMRCCVARMDQLPDDYFMRRKFINRLLLLLVEGVMKAHGISVEHSAMDQILVEVEKMESALKIISNHSRTQVVKSSIRGASTGVPAKEKSSSENSGNGHKYSDWTLEWLRYVQPATNLDRIAVVVWGGPWSVWLCLPSLNQKAKTGLVTTSRFLDISHNCSLCLVEYKIQNN